MILVDRVQMQAIDRYAIEVLKVPALSLVERASMAVLKHINLNKFGYFGVVVGVGNNGADGLALARNLLARYKDVEIFIIGDVEKASPEFKLNLESCEMLCEEIYYVESIEDLENMEKRLSNVNLIVDAIFGTGLNRPVTGIYATVISIINNNYSIQEISSFLFGGFSKADLPQNIASLLNRGGINSMFFTLTIVILALSLGGLLFGLGIIPTLLDSMAHLLISPSRATICVVLTALGVNYIVGEQYLSILLAGKTFKPIYDKLGLHSKNLSRTLEDAGTVVNPLVPWGVCGVFITSVLGVSTLTYLPFSFFCYLCVILTIISGFTGISISKK